LQNKNIRMTKQRKFILQEVRNAKDHPTAYEVYEKVRRHIPNISLGTVYRNLDILSEKGIIKKIETPETQMRFDGRTDPHYHVRCKRCGKVDDLPLEPLYGLEGKAAQASGYQIEGHAIEFVGVCPKCGSKRGVYA